MELISIVSVKDVAVPADVTEQVKAESNAVGNG